MYSVSGTTIKLTRGDYMALPITLKKDGETYTPQVGDEITFGLKHKTMNNAKSEYTDVEPLLTKDISIATLTLVLDEDDTKDLGFGEYVYDIQYTSDDKPYTPINNAKFVIVPEVI